MKAASDMDAPFASRRPAARLAAALGLCASLGASLGGCANLPDLAADPDFALCEQARGLARRGDTAAAEAAIDRMRDLRNAWYCKNDVLELDKGLHPRGT